ncbi:O-antigen ligase family protein [Psychrobacillus sp. NPDC096623]|uniref:O-antigen ligase family protein n=1 Tax=Psychrobacillus sp. NPDC096623 TaxID=3364492 RepID=UPI0037F7B3D4
MTYLIFLLIFVIFIYFIIKYRVNGFIYLIVFMLPFRFEIFSISGIGIRITDILSMFYIAIWLFTVLLGYIKKSDIKLLSPILIFLIIVVFGFLINAFRFSSISNMIDLIRLILALITGIAIGSNIKDRSNLIILFKTWAVSATLSSAISIFFFFSNGYSITTLLNLNILSVVEFYSIKFSNSVFFEDPNNLASYLLVSIFITIGLSVDNYFKYKYKYLFLAIQILGLVLTLSRSAYLAAGITVIIYLFAHKITNYKWLLLKIGLIFIILVNSFSLINSVNSVLNSDLSVLSRSGLWQVGLNMSISNPFLGVGIGNSSIVFNQYISSSLVLYNPHFHNLFLTISAEIGLIGLIYFISIFFKHLYKWSRSTDKLYIFLCLGLISYLIQSLGVEYFASRHFWIFVPLLILYSSPKFKGRMHNGVSIGTTPSI